MKKTILALLSATLMLSIVSPAQAEDQKVLAIIDTGINSKNFTSVVYEACFAASVTTGCVNGKTFMEGKGSASSLVWPSSVNSNTYHGDSMVKAALVVNPSLKIVFIRVADITSTGNNSIYSDSLISAISWVSSNAEKYSIDAVSISLSGVNKDISVANTVNKVITASPNCANQTVISSVASLNLKNIPTFAATGNDGSKTIVGFPACIPGVIGVGSLTNQVDAGVKVGETATNRGPGLDIVALGAVTINKYGLGSESAYQLAGSSGANVVAASTYIKNNVYKTSTEYIASLKKESIKFVDSNDKKSGILIWEPSRIISYSSN